MKDGKEEYIRKFKKELIVMMSKGQRINKNFMTKGLTRLELFALQQIRDALNENPGQAGIHVSVLAKRMGVLLSSASRTLNTLDERGLIYREIDPENRRNVCVFLTEKGEKVREKCFENMNELIERVIEKMGKEDMDQLIELWKKYSDFLEKEVKLMSKKEE